MSREPSTSPLVAAAEALDAELRRFENQVAVATRDRLSSARELERTAQALGQVPEIEKQLRARVDALLEAFDAVRRAQEQQAQQAQQRALELQERAAQFAELMSAYTALGEQTQQLNSLGRELSGRSSTAGNGASSQLTAELHAGLADIGERVGGLVDAARDLGARSRETGFGELTSAVESLRQQLLAVKNRIGLARAKLPDED